MTDSERLHQLVGASVAERVATELLERWLTEEGLAIVRRAQDCRRALAQAALDRQHGRWAG